MSTAEILDKAAEVIETRGWHQGRNSDPNGTGVCAIGAIKVALGLIPDADMIDVPRSVQAAMLGAVRHVEKHVGEYWLNVWNDDVAESAEQVVTALREAARTAGGA